MKGGLFVCPVTRKGGLFVCPASLEKSADCFVILCGFWQATADKKEDPSCELLEIEGNRLDALTFQSLLSDYRVHISDISMQDALGFNYVSQPLNTMLFQVTSVATDQDTGDTTSNSNSGSTSSQQTSNSNSKQEATQASSGSGKGGKQKKDTIGSSSEGGGDDDENRKKKDEKLKHDSISRASKKAERKRLLKEAEAAWLIRQAELLAASEEDEDTESNSNDATSPNVVVDAGHVCQPTPLNATSALPTCHQQAQVDMLLHHLAFQQAQNETLLAPPLQSAQNDTLPTPPLQSAQHAASPTQHAASPIQHAASPTQHAASPTQHAASPTQHAASPAQNETDVLASTLASLFPITHFSSTVVANNRTSTSEDSGAEVHRSTTPLSLISAASDHVAASGAARSTASSPGPSTPKPPTRVTSPNIDFNAWETAFGCPLSTPRSSAGEGGNASQHLQTILPNDENLSTPDPTSASCTTTSPAQVVTTPTTTSPAQVVVTLTTTSPAQVDATPTSMSPAQVVATPTSMSPAQFVAIPKKRVVNCAACKRGKKPCPKCVAFNTSVSASVGLNEGAAISMWTRRRSRNSSPVRESPEADSTELHEPAVRVPRRHPSRANMSPLLSNVGSNEGIITSVSTEHHSSSPREFSEVNSTQLHTHGTTFPVPLVVQLPQSQLVLNNTVAPNVHHTPWTSMGAATSPHLPFFSESNNMGAVNGAASNATSNTNAFPNRNPTHSVVVCNVCIRACTCVICYT